jgi:hypothetical protein
MISMSAEGYRGGDLPWGRLRALSSPHGRKREWRALRSGLALELDGICVHDVVVIPCLIKVRRVATCLCVLKEKDVFDVAKRGGGEKQGTTARNVQKKSK